MDPEAPPLAPPPPTPEKKTIFPADGEVITSLATGNTYTIQGKIGEGAFGVVYACTDQWRNELAAKVLKGFAAWDKTKEAAEAEFQKLRILSHPFITFCFDAWEFRDTFYIVTERCHSPLKDLFRLNPFDGPLWLPGLARCLLQAVHYLHLQNYVHSEIHAGNVFTAFVADEMMPTGTKVLKFKLGDLGVTKVVEEVTGQNTMAMWMRPPEVLRPAEFGPPDRRIDIHHLGLLFLQFASSKEIQFTPDEILAGKPRELALELPPPYNTALQKALRRHVADRTGSALELWRDLNTGTTG